MLANRNGGAVNANAYDEFGVPDENNGGRFQFTGQQYVPELGMYYYKHVLSACPGRQSKGPACTHPCSGGSCRPIRLAMAMA